jgi:hypothetical protein
MTDCFSVCILHDQDSNRSGSSSSGSSTVEAVFISAAGS